MDDFRIEALDFYNKSSNEVKALAKKFFNHLDSDGDSSINCAEFFTFIRRNKLLSRLSITFEVFQGLDRDGNDKLDFNEFITFFYVIFGKCVCDCCGVKLMGQRHMTCNTCFASKGDTFDLCYPCLSSKRFKHQHAYFLDFKLLILESIPSNSSTSTQPKVCEVEKTHTHTPTMDDFRIEALDFYNKSSNEVKALAKKFFNHLDSDGDSSINCAEFFTFIRRNKLLSRLSITFEVFQGLDRDGNDKLDFNEFITFFYVIFGKCVCDCCGVKLLGQRHMTCNTCFASKGDDTFDLCYPCLSSKRFKHQHAYFLDFKLLILESIPSYSSTSTQPVVLVEEDVVLYRKRDKTLKVLEGTLKALEVVDAVASCHIM